MNESNQGRLNIPHHTVFPLVCIASLVLRPVWFIWTALVWVIQFWRDHPSFLQFNQMAHDLCCTKHYMYVFINLKSYVFFQKSTLLLSQSELQWCLCPVMLSQAWPSHRAHFCRVIWKIVPTQNSSKQASSVFKKSRSFLERNVAPEFFKSVSWYPEHHRVSDVCFHYN